MLNAGERMKSALGARDLLPCRIGTRAGPSSSRVIAIVMPSSWDVQRVVTLRFVVSFVFIFN